MNLFDIVRCVPRKNIPKKESIKYIFMDGNRIVSHHSPKNETSRQSTNHHCISHQHKSYVEFIKNELFRRQCLFC